MPEPEVARRILLLNTEKAHNLRERPWKSPGWPRTWPSWALKLRQESAARVLELDAAVTETVAGLKARGFESPYLRAFVVARINPIRFKRGAKVEFEEALDKMLAAARRFDPGKVREGQIARTGGAPEE